MWTPLIAFLDAVIDAAGGRPVEPNTTAIFNAVVKAASELRAPDAPKLALVVTSGTAVHGHNSKEVVNDTTPIGAFNPPVAFARWRPAHEQNIVTSNVVNGIVIRPVIVYGYSGSLTGQLFKTAYEGQVKWWGEAGLRASFIHRDDLGELFRLVTERSMILKGLIFDAANDFTESMDEIMAKLAEVSGANGYQYITDYSSVLILSSEVVSLLTK